MKQKILTTALLLAASVVTSMAAEVEGLTVSYFESGTSSYVQALSAIGKISFETPDAESETHAIIKFNDSKIADEDLGALTDIDRITFGKVDENSITTEETPTAVVDIKGIAEDQTIRIFTIGGVLVGEQQGTQANLEGFDRGAYIIQCGSKIIKVIKK